MSICIKARLITFENVSKHLEKLLRLIGCETLDISTQKKEEYIQNAKGWIENLKAVQTDSIYYWNSHGKDFIDGAILVRGIENVIDTRYSPGVGRNNLEYGMVYNLYYSSTIPSPMVILGLYFSQPNGWTIGRPEVHHTHGN